MQIPKPSIEQVKKYLKKWNSLDKGKYYRQEEALNKLFFELCPNNKDINSILIKAAVLNDFYSTNIYHIYAVANHIEKLAIDERLDKGDENLVDDLKKVKIGNKEINFYSFATKYCSHHKPEYYPIYDKYVGKALIYFRNEYKFCEFKNDGL
ncbi:hypothetical protein [uncultured Brachyspira sp.]|uniref:hypothetical protein n=1 Tax=uncultured Brachyspira sp. TaxID=221953 RepID=UPI0025DB7774|nr:hypothetical protein [uncultured Brachyspira sp.]